MRGKGNHRRAAISVAALGVLAAFVLTGLAGAKSSMIIPFETIEWTFNFGFSPLALSKTKPTPVALNLSGQLKTADGTHPPALQELILENDKNGAIDVKGLPVCRPRPPEESGAEWVNEVCKNAIVGRGTMNVNVAFPEQSPISMRSALTIFNGGSKQGVTTLFAHAFLKNPVSAAVVSRVEIKRIHKGRFGTKATISFPVIAGGNGSVTAFDTTLYKRFSYQGKRASLVTLECPDGRIQARAEAIFSDGTNAGTQVLRPCIAKG